MDEFNPGIGQRELTQSVVEVFEEGFPSGLNLETLAEQVGSSPRTIQRHLRNARTSYKSLADQARFNAALQRVIGTNDSMTEIAMDLMYGDPSSFTRAFRRWTGMPPSAYRKLSRAMNNSPGLLLLSAFGGYRADTSGAPGNE